MGGRLRGAVVGLRMGRAHLRAMLGHPEVEVSAVCDLNPEARDKALEEARAAGAEPRGFDDWPAMLAEAQPELLAIATPNRLHAAMTCQAVAAGVRAICCEKPMALDLAEARAMVRACREAGVPLVINHQRRVGTDLVWLREQIAAGALGEVSLIRATCAGDMLSDGTHLIDSALFLAGDPEWEWVFAGWHRDQDGGDEVVGGGFDKVGGWRFGHPVEDGLFAVCQLAGGPRVELLTGDLRVPGRPYHDLEIMGSRGSLWRAGDSLGTNLFCRGADGGWEPVPDRPGPDVRPAIPESYRRLVELTLAGGDDREHPMGAANALRGFELLIGALESGRTGAVVRPPVSQECYPLAVAPDPT
ncbi:MAG: Gfo/Idh/MocA family oxidoreductase [Armatimonadetes bacterium]|nr:Gfo/Idh/MocA family oxidoreductase [Armatimonadota bacterium]